MCNRLMRICALVATMHWIPCVSVVSAADKLQFVAVLPQSLEFNRIAEALGKIKTDYVDAVEDRTLTMSCRGGMLRWVSEQMKLLQTPIGIGPSQAKMPMDQIAETLARIKQQFPDVIDEKKIADACLHGMASNLDAHSVYLDEHAFKELRTGTEGQFGALGLEVGIEDGFLKIVATIEDTPARRAGLRSGDLITMIDNVSTKGIPLIELVKQLRGKPGTTVRIAISRKGEPEPLQLELTRAAVLIRSARWSIAPGGYLYLRISRFDMRSLDLLAEGLRLSNRQIATGIRGVILDLRNNSGGLLYTSVGIAAAFLPGGNLVVTTQGRAANSTAEFKSSPEDYARGKSSDPLKDLPDDVKSVPMVVIVNRGTAAGAEIVAASLQDHKRAKILGERTPGSGTIQTIIPIGDGAALRLTTARFHRPSGQPIEAVGVMPDVAFQARADISASQFGTVNDPGFIQALKLLGEATPSAR